MQIFRSFLLSSALAGVASAQGPTANAVPASRPNIVVLVADDMGWNDIGYHCDQLHTPCLDRLAAAGVELDCHYVQPQCTPTRVALLTGRYPSRFGKHCTQASNERAVARGTATMASMLKSLGYETALTGKWHLGSKPEWGPNHYGFDSSHGSLAGAVGMYDHRYRLESPFVTTWHRDHEWIEEEGHVTDLCASEAVRFIEKKRDGPFFLYVPFHAVHTPLVERDGRWFAPNAHIESKDRRLFAAALTHLDAAVGRIVASLERTKQRDNTLIVFMSDNGGLPNYRGGNYPPPDSQLKNYSSNKPLRGRKTHVFEGGMRVPAFVSWPGKLAARRVTAPMHVVDWMPTLAALTGYALGKEAKWDGRDLWPLLNGTRDSWQKPRELYWVWGGRNRIALRAGRWKLLRNGRKKPWLLFDLVADPNESSDLAATNPKKLEELHALLRAQRARDAD
ncbi:MAG: arylsulfatase [Planctomycetes bacterium]|nr:arylsulfatase [Planctomycetota bacterium]